jgi:ATP-dependent Zn protease
MMMPDNLERAATHEAGHIVAHWHFGRSVSFAFITPDGNGITSMTQSVQYPGEPRQPTRLAADHGQLVAAMAGRAAEALRYPALPKDELVRISQSDEEKASDLVRDLCGTNLSDIEVTARVNDALAEASHVLYAAWPAVMALAAALLGTVSECGLDGAQIATLIKEALHSPP